MKKYNEKLMNDIYDASMRSRCILVITEHSKTLLEVLVGKIYKNYPSSKQKIVKINGLMNKLRRIKNKLIFIDVDLSKIQFSSSNTTYSIQKDFSLMVSYAAENGLHI